MIKKEYNYRSTCILCPHYKPIIRNAWHICEHPQALTKSGGGTYVNSHHKKDMIKKGLCK